MYNTKREAEIVKISSIVFFSLLLFNVLGETIIQPYRNLARVTDDITLYLTFLMFIYFLIRKRLISPEYLNIYLGFIFLGLSYLISHFYNTNFKQNDQLILLFLTFIFIIVLIELKWSSEQLIIIGHISNIIIFVFLFHWIDNDFTFYKYKGIFGNPNVFANLLFTLLYFQIINIKNRKIIYRFYFFIGIFINLSLIYMTTSRTVVLSVAVMFFSWLTLKFSVRLFSKLFFLIVSGNFAFLLIYVLLSKSNLANTINNLSYKYTQKVFFSGREDIWGGVINYGMTSPFFGHKVGIQIKEYLPSLPYNHTHNQFLQIFVESGFLGLFFFLLLLYFIWKTYLKNLESHYVHWSACFFLGLLVYQNIEISLFFNMMSIGLIQWLIISIGVSKSVNHEDFYQENQQKRRLKRSRLSSKL